MHVSNDVFFPTSFQNDLKDLRDCRAVDGNERASQLEFAITFDFSCTKEVKDLSEPRLFVPFLGCHTGLERKQSLPSQAIHQ